MKWTSALSTIDDLNDAVASLAQDIFAALDESQPDLVCAFVSPYHREHLHRLPALLESHLATKKLIGCTAMGLVGGGQEIDPMPQPRPGLSLTAARLPGVTVKTLHLDSDTPLPHADAPPGAWTDRLGIPASAEPHFIILGDPYTYDPRPLLMGLDYAYPSGTKSGGLASAQGGNVLFCGDTMYDAGVVCLALSGNIAVDGVVAQGCRPIGKPLTVTAGQGNVIEALDDQPAASTLQNIYESLAGGDRELIQRALHIGIASTELRANFDQGDFLIRHVVNLDQDRGSLVIDDQVRCGRTVQFHLRDATTAHEDLHMLLERYHKVSDATSAAGALLFTCTGRGKMLYDAANHDSSLFRAALGTVPLGGFFCGGEIGQVGNATYLHGYTSAFAIFKPLTKTETGPH